MPKAPRDNKEGATPKKRSRKVTTQPENGVHGDKGNGPVAHSVAVSPEFAAADPISSNIEEQIRLRAYQLYMERNGHGGSPEQDWFRAMEEICGRGGVA